MVPIGFKGDRIEKGEEIELSAEDAARLGTDVVPVGGAVVEEIEEEEKSLDDMTKAELAAKAEALGLPTSGTKADLIEKITLHLAGGGSDQPEDEEVE
jgi:hypothetical protein